jgi:hypothetical protein
MKPLLACALLIAFTHVAHARDHLELVCAAVSDAKDGGEKVPLFVRMFEHRADDGQSRDEELSTIYQGALFQASHRNKTGDFSKGVKISLTNAKAIRFRGTYTLESAGDGYALKLTGEVNEDPFARKAEFRAVTATLPCVDLSI